MIASAIPLKNLLILSERTRPPLSEVFDPEHANAFAHTHVSIAVNLAETGNESEAHEHLAQAVSIIEMGRAAHPRGLTPEMADVLGRAYFEQGRLASDSVSAFDAFSKAKDVWEILHDQLGGKHNPTLRTDLARAYLCCGQKIRATDMRQAVALYAKAIRFLELLHEQLGEQFTDYMAWCLSKAYFCYAVDVEAIGDKEDAVGAAEKSIALGEKLRRGKDGTFTAERAEELASTYHWYSRNVSDRQTSTETCLAAIEILREAVRHYPTQFTRDMSVTLARLYSRYAGLVEKSGDYTSAVAACTQVIVIWQTLRARSGDDVSNSIDHELAFAYLSIASVHHVIGDATGERAALAQTIELLENSSHQMGEAFPRNVAEGLAVAYVELAKVTKTNDATAVTCYTKAIEIWEAMGDPLTGTFQEDIAKILARTYADRGEALMRLGDAKAMYADCLRATALLKSLREQL